MYWVAQSCMVSKSSIISVYFIITFTVIIAVQMVYDIHIAFVMFRGLTEVKYND